MTLIGPPGWERRGYPEPRLSPTVAALLEHGARSEGEEALVRAGEQQFIRALPSDLRAFKVPRNAPIDAIVHAAARLHRDIAAGAQADLDRARFGVARALAELGMWAAKRQLEDAVLQAEVSEHSKRVKRLFAEFMRVHDAFFHAVETSIVESLREQGVEATAISVWCSTDGAARRLQALRLNDFSAPPRPTDFCDVYVLVDSEADCYRALQTVHALGQPVPGAFQDLVATPHGNGFSALATRVSIPRSSSDATSGALEIVNVTVQTRLMHEIAWLGISHPLCAHAEPDAPRFIRELLRGGTTPLEARPQITVYTRGGRRIDVTAREIDAGATVLDLAYKVFHELGDAATGAIVDGEQVESLGHVLRPGAVVTILRDHHRANVRTADDLMLVTTPSARQRLRRGLSHEESGRLAIVSQLGERGIAIGPGAELDRFVELAVPDRSPADVYRRVTTQEGADAVAGSVADEFLSRGAGRTWQGYAAGDEWRPSPAEGRAVKAGVARTCGHCNPVPARDNREQKPIVGVEHGRHVTVHLATCRHARGRETVPMEWTLIERVRSELQVTGADRPGLVMDLCRAIAGHGCGLERIEAWSRAGQAWATLHVYGDTRSVQSLRTVLPAVQGVGRVRVKSKAVPIRPLEPGTTRRPQGGADGRALPLQPNGRYRPDAFVVPYDPQRPSERDRFYGRERESAHLAQHVNASRASFLFLVGPRKIGKSSLALRFSDRHDDVERHVARVDLRRCMTKSSRETFARIATALRTEPFIGADVPDHDEPADTVRAMVASCDRPLLLILDEFGGPLISARDELLGPEFFAWVREEMEAMPQRATIMMAAPPDALDLLRRLDPPDLERIDTYDVGWLDGTATRAMLTAPFEDQGISIADAVVAHAVDATGGHPYYVIALLNRLAEILNRNRRKWEINASDVRRAKKALLAEQRLFSGWVRDSAPTLTSLLTLAALVRVGQGPQTFVPLARIAAAADQPVEDAREALDRFARHQVVEHRPGGGDATYAVTFELLWEWIRLGGLRRNYFSKLDPTTLRVLFSLSDLTSGQASATRAQIARHADVASETAAKALDALVKLNAVSQHRGRFRLEHQYLRMWTQHHRSERDGRIRNR